MFAFFNSIDAFAFKINLVFFGLRKRNRMKLKNFFYNSIIKHSSIAYCSAKLNKFLKEFLALFMSLNHKVHFNNGYG